MCWTKRGTACRAAVVVVVVVVVVVFEEEAETPRRGLRRRPD